ncbi:unnamed protein product [Rotaria sordida]|uniref:Uncharacterized protein n=1 Tax=Rotaria sordida TaxID=392033 RepID=A0A819PW12_9BILA|nr:unnamed protein product [Rotaria sordida]CAF4021179.1 unnamed protein product [Rotaria sordida]
MATAVGEKTPCSICQKAVGVFTCRGCGKDFCYRHVAEHRQELNKQMDELTTNHDELQQTITEQEVRPNCHPLIQKINKWEQESIDKIHQTADDARKQVITILGMHRTQVIHDLSCLTKKLNEVRNEDNYVETDLKEWTEKLDKLKIDLNAAQTIDFGEENNSSTLISKFSINDASTDIFYQTVGDIQIIEDGKVAVRGPTNNGAVEIRCKGEYSLGKHRFHFKCERLLNNNSFSCGIVSKSTPTKYCYFQTTGVYELLVDCNEHIIRLTQEQSGNTQELKINLDTCPLPWQFFIALFHANDCVRLC